MDKRAIKNFSIEARNILITGITNKLSKMGITPTGNDKVNELGPGLIEIETTRERFSGSQIISRNSIIEELRKREKNSSRIIAYENFVEEVSYTWFNRLIAIRFMEVNDYLPERMRVLSSETIGKKEPDIITNLLDTELFSEMDSSSKERVTKLIFDGSASSVDELYQFVFTKVCNSLNSYLPDLFEKLDDYTEFLFTFSYIDENGVIAKLLSIPEEDFDVSKGGQIEIIGWMYQYYNTEPKDKVFARKKTEKIRADQIPAATQLFTPEWIVRYMVENSLGRYYIDHKIANPMETRTEKEIADSFGWKYYLPAAEQTEEVQLKIIEKQKNRNDFVLQEVKLLDNAMGSGHILVYAFDVFIQLYEAEGYSNREAAELIIENNLFGLELDKRAYQLAYFAIMMKARQYSRRILSRSVAINLHYFEDSPFISEELVLRLKENTHLSDNDFVAQIDTLSKLTEKFNNASELGSIIKLSEFDLESIENLRTLLDNLGEYSNMDILYSLPELLGKIGKVLDISEIILSKYQAIVTNPPYLNKMSTSLASYVNKYYKDVKTDLFSVFIKVNNNMLDKNGYSGFMTPFVWMFIKSYENLRNSIINRFSISSLIQMEYSAFEEATVPVCCFTIKNSEDEPVGSYFKLSEFRGGMKVQEDKVLNAIENSSIDYFYQTNQKNFNKIPGSPISFWVSENLVRNFQIGQKMGDVVNPKQGLATADNNHFLRQWWEVKIDNIKFDATSIADSVNSGKKWFPYNKGGAFRRWYGNYDYVVNWENDGQEIRNFVDNKGKQRSVVRNPSFYFQEAITWSDITSSKFSLRYREKGSIHDVKGMQAFSDDKVDLYYILGVLNSHVGNYIFKLLNPTISLQIGNFQSFPLLFSKEDYTITKSIENVKISKVDFNSFEDSSEFKKHPLI